MNINNLVATISSYFINIYVKKYAIYVSLMNKKFIILNSGMN